MSSGIYPTLTPFTQLEQITEAELVGTMNLLIDSGLNVNQYVSLQILVEWINQNWSNVENLPPLQVTDLTVTPPVTKYVTYNILAQAIQSLGINFTQTQNQELLAHLVNYDNPHKVTAAQVGLNFIQNYPVTTDDDIGTNPPTNTYVTYNILEQALDSFNLGILQELTLVPNYPPFNPNEPTNGQGDTLITYADLQDALFSTQTFNNGNVLTPQQIQQLAAHLVNYNNPHRTTAEQVGLGNVANLTPTYNTDIQAVQLGGQPSDTYITYNILSQALATLPVNLTSAQIQALMDHLVNYDNPHEVTAAQVGLGNVANLLPIGQSDINAVDSGSSPDDTYITYNMLALANTSLGYTQGYGVTVSITSDSVTLTSANITANINSQNLSLLNGTNISFNYKVASSSQWVTFATLPLSTNLTYSDVITGLSENTSYNFQAIITSPSNSNFNIYSNILQTTTGNGTQLDSTASFNIVSIGDISTTTALDSTTVTGTGIAIKENLAIALEDNASCNINPINQINGEPNFVSFIPTLAYRPKNLLSQNTLNSTSNILLTDNINNIPQNGDQFTVNSNGSLFNVTNGSNINYNLGVSFNNIRIIGRTMPILLVSPFSCSYTNSNGDSYIYVFGGQQTAGVPGYFSNADFNTNIYYVQIVNGEMISDLVQLSTTNPNYGGIPFVLGNNILLTGTWTIASGNTGLSYQTGIYLAPINSNGTLGNFSQIGTLPVAMCPNLVLGNGYIYLVGGNTSYDNSGSTNINTVYYATITDTGTIGTWNTTNSIPSGNASAGMTGIILNNFIYMFGGFYNTSSPSLNQNIYYAAINTDGSLGSWQSYAVPLQNTPFAFQDPTVFSIGSDIYLISNIAVEFDPGNNGEFATFGNYIWKATINSSGVITDFYPISYFNRIGIYYDTGTTVIGNKIYSFGGQVVDSSSSTGVTSVSTIFSMDIDLNNGASEPYQVPEVLLPNPVAYIDPIAYNGNIYVIGGIEYNVQNVATNVGNDSVTITFNNNDSYTSNVSYIGLTNGKYISSINSTTAFPININAGKSLVIGTTLYYFGGANATENVSSIYYAPINSDGTLGSWQLSNITLPQDLSEFGLIYIENTTNSYVYILGGESSNGRVNTVYQAPVVNGTLGSFTQYGLLPSTLGFFTPIYINGYIYIVDGSTNDSIKGGTFKVNNVVTGTNTKAYRCLVNSDGSLGTWQEADDNNFYYPPYGADGCGVVINGNYLYRLGGWIAGSLTSIISRAFIYENGNLGKWENTNVQLPANMNHFGCISIENIIYVIGGFQIDTNTVFDANSSGNIYEAYPTTNAIYAIDLGYSTVEAINSYTFPTNIDSFFYSDPSIRQPVGLIGSGTPQPLIANGNPTIVGETIIQTYDSVTGNGTEIQLGMTNLQEGDIVSQFAAEVYD